MSGSEKTYTYRGGQKVELEKSPDQIVVKSMESDTFDRSNN